MHAWGISMPWFGEYFEVFVLFSHEFDLEHHVEPRIDDALDAAEDVAARFRPHRLLQLRSDHQKAQAELDLDTRAAQKRLEMVLEAHGPLQRSLCHLECRRVEA